MDDPIPVAHYDHPAQFEPLLPAEPLQRELGLRARSVVEGALRLQRAAHPAALEQLRELVREMNSYYSNRIEGQSTHPQNIARALRQDFSAEPDVARRQRLALAHIEAERDLEQQQTPESQVLTSSLLRKAHHALYSRLDEADRMTEDGHVVDPGALRADDVTVNRHQPPTAASIPAFLARIDQAYGKPWTLDTQLVAAACAHHRAAWVHPFRDGNGRAVRLQTHSALCSLNAGLWSVNRGLARRRDEYYARLSDADMARQGALDGRGNLSQRMLVKWCEFFIAICEDQVSFMEAMLNLGDFKRRLQALVLVRSQVDKASGYRPELVIPLHYALTSGPVSRGEFIQMTGLGERTARNSLQRLLLDGLLISDTPRGEVRLGFPLSSLSVLFPNLYPEAATTPIEG